MKKNLLITIMLIFSAIWSFAQTSISDVQNGIATGVVTVSGTITAVSGTKFYIQDAEAAWSGIYVYTTTSYSPVVGDSVSVTATVAEYNGLTELTTVTAYNLIASGKTVNPVVVTTAEANTEPYESVLIKVEGAECTTGNTSGTWGVDDGSGEVLVYKTLYDYTSPVIGSRYDVTGVTTWYNAGGVFEILPRSVADITEILTGSEANIISFVLAEQTGNATIDVNLATVTIEVVNGTNLAFLTPTIEVSPNATINPASGVAQDFTNQVTYTVTAQDLTEKIWTVTVTEAAAIPVLTIHDIQYTTDVSGNSPYNGAQVTTTGTITAVIGTNFYIQESETAWSGVYVYDGSQTPVIGDNVTITGTVSEYNNLTEITSLTSYTVNSSGNTVSPVTLTTVEVNDEQYESVLVSVLAAECLSAPDGFGVWSADDGSGAINVDDIMYAASPVIGTFYNITGIAYERLGDYRILPRYASDISIAVFAEKIEKETIQIYPNPASEMLNIVSEVNISKIEIRNIIGQTVKSSSNSNNINISQLDSGLYFVVLFDGKKVIAQQKFVKK